MQFHKTFPFFHGEKAYIFPFIHSSIQLVFIQFQWYVRNIPDHRTKQTNNQNHTWKYIIYIKAGWFWLKEITIYEAEWCHKRESLINRQLFDESTKLIQLDNSRHEGKASIPAKNQKTQSRLLEEVKVGWRTTDLVLLRTVIMCPQLQVYLSFLLISLLCCR